MRVLAIDSSGLTATVGIVEDTQTIAEYTVNYKTSGNNSSSCFALNSSHSKFT